MLPLTREFGFLAVSECNVTATKVDACQRTCNLAVLVAE